MLLTEHLVDDEPTERETNQVDLARLIFDLIDESDTHELSLSALFAGLAARGLILCRHESEDYSVSFNVSGKAPTVSVVRSSDSKKWVVSLKSAALESLYSSVARSITMVAEPGKDAPSISCKVRGGVMLILRGFASSLGLPVSQKIGLSEANMAMEDRLFHPERTSKVLKIGTPFDAS